MRYYSWSDVGLAKWTSPGKSPAPRRTGLTGNGGCGTRPGGVEPE